MVFINQKTSCDHVDQQNCDDDNHEKSGFAAEEEDLLTVSNKEYLLASVSFDRRVVITSIKQRMQIFQKDIKQYLE